MALLLLAIPSMPEPDDEHHVERKVVYETVSSSSSRMTGVTVFVIIAIAIAVLAYIIMNMR